MPGIRIVNNMQVLVNIPNTLQQKIIPRNRHWDYAGYYRIICRLHDDILVVEAVKIRHRREVYKCCNLDITR